MLTITVVLFIDIIPVRAGPFDFFPVDTGKKSFSFCTVKLTSFTTSLLALLLASTLRVSARSAPAPAHPADYLDGMAALDAQQHQTNGAAQL